MPKAIWTGSLTFGLVNIPIKAYPAIKDRTISFKTLHSECHAPLQYKRWCPKCEREVNWNEVDKGYPITKDKFIVLTNKELESLQLKTTKSVEIQKFTDLASIDSIYFNDHYYLAPGEGGERAYALLRDVLSLLNKVALGKVTFRNKEHMVAIRPYQKGLVMTTLHYPDEVIAIDRLEELGRLEASREQELQLAKMLIERMEGDFKPEENIDNYRSAVMNLIKQKAEGVEIAAVKPVEVRATVDLMKALEESVLAIKKEKQAPSV